MKTYTVYKVLGDGSAVFFARPGKWVSEYPDAQVFDTKREASFVARLERALIETVNDGE